MAAKLAAELGIHAQIIQGDKGIFDVVADGKLIYSKQREGRFPDEDSIVEALAPTA